MSHSVVTDFPVERDDTLVLVVDQHGEVSVDQETLEGLMKLGNTNVSILRVDQEGESTVDMTLETFHPSTTAMDELTVNVDEHSTRNLLSIRMDHCYTPLTSPSQQKQPISQDQIDNELELDDLAQTLSILEGSDKPPEPVPPTKTVSSVKVFPKVAQKEPQQQQLRNDVQNSDKVTMLNKVNKLGVNKVYKGVKTVLAKGQKLFRKPVHPHPESDPEEDDSNDSDFELNDAPTKMKQAKRTYKRRSKLENHNEVNSTEMRNKIVKVRKGMKHIVYKPQSPQKPVLPAEVKTEPVSPSPEALKSPEIKKLPPKKEKKPLKPIVDDGIALFSTPDIIRRVGSGKTPEKRPDSPETSPKAAKPARIEDRSKSETGKLSTETKIKMPHRLSLDSKVSHSTPEKIKTERTSTESKHSERRSSIASDKSTDISAAVDQTPPGIVPLASASLPAPDSATLSAVDSASATFDSIAAAVGNLENEIPTPAFINAVESTKPFVTPMETDSVTNAVLSQVTPSVVDPAQLSLEGTGLDIDPAILDNINADELIPEDILYQVAKLVENPDVQNVIDRTLTDPSLNLDATIQPQITSQVPVITPQTQLISPVTQPPLPLDETPQNAVKNTTQKSIQIVRSDGRVVILPPIEKPATRSSKKKQEPDPHQQQQQQQQQPPIKAPPQQQQLQPVVPPAQPQHVQPTAPPQKIQNIVRHVPKMPEEAGVEQPPSDLESDSDESWNSEDDPDRLWCICKQPHNNRFMICCDTCEDWFHGKCVNITKAMGQQMEQRGKEWMCPNCTKKVNAPPGTPTLPVTGMPSAKVAPDAIQKRKSTDNTPPCIVCASPSRANSVYCSDACILKHAQGVEKAPKSAVPQRIIVFERSTGKCLSGPNAPSAANLKQWLKEHPGFEVVRPVSKQSLVQSKLQFVKNPPGKEGVALAVNRKSVQMGVLPHSSKQQPQQNTIKLIPAAKLNVPGMKTAAPKQPGQTPPAKAKLVQTTLKSPTTPNTPPTKLKPVAPSPKPEKTPVRERKQKLQPTPQTPDTPKQNGPENIRDTVKKTILEQLTTRLREVEDLKLTEQEVDKMATEIEVQLYKLFGDSGPKYRTKYRSLIFNIKDAKNQTLWRRICEKDIAPAQLVRLSPEEMASQELARWRERENKHQLDMIKKSELEMLTINRTYVLKTHKGEQVMEDRPSVKVDSTDIMSGLGADSTSEQDGQATDRSETGGDHSSVTERRSNKHSRRDRDRDKRGSNDRSDRSSSKDRRNSKDHTSKGRSKRSRSRDRDHDRSSHRSDRKRSRSRDRHHRSSHKSSRHKRDKHSTEHLDKKSREILDNLENNKIVPPPEDRLWKHVPQQDIQVATPDSDSDHEPTSTVTIPTPPRSSDQEEPQNPSAKQTDISVAAGSTTPKQDQKSDAKVSRSDPRLTRATSVETSKSDSPQPPTTAPSESNSPVPPVQSKFTSESKEAIIWEGNINMVDVAKFFITLHEVSGDCSGLGTELPSTLEIVGRISPDTVWDYIGKMRRSNSKLISILRLTAGNVEEKMPYIALYSYLSSRNRLGVIKSTNNAVKDFYILPLASHAPVPQALLPLSGPGFEESRPHLLLGIIVRAKRKRPSTMDIITGASSIKRSRVEGSPTVTPAAAVTVVPTAAGVTAQPPRSYTPPPTRDPRIRLPTVPAAVASNDEDEPYSPEDSDPETVLTSTISRKPAEVKAVTQVPVTAAAVAALQSDISSVLTATLKTTTFLETATAAVTSFEPFNSKFDAIPGLDVDAGVDSLQRKMAELDKCIEKQKEEIRSISQDIVSSGAAASMATNLSNISLPSNLQQILDSIKNIPSTTTGTSTEEYCPTAPGYRSTSGSEELTIPLMLPKISSRTQAQSVKPAVSEPLTGTIPLQLPVAPRELPPVDITLPNLTVPPPSNPTVQLGLPNTNMPPPLPPPVVLPNLSVPPPSAMSSAATIPLNLPKLKSKASPPITTSAAAVCMAPLTPPGTAPVIIPPGVADPKPASVLSSLSEEELIRKAAEMLGEAEPTREDTSPEPEDEAVEENGDDGSDSSSSSSTAAAAATAAFKSAPVMYTPPPVLPSAKRTKLDVSQPPVPGLEDEY